MLVVDDKPENLSALSELLLPHYQVLVATTGERALQLATLTPQPSLILLDVVMPAMDGYAVLLQLRGNPATRDIPVIFVTSRDTDVDHEHGFRLGAVDYITKPIRPAIVLARIGVHLENKRARDLLEDHNVLLAKEVEQRLRDKEIVQDASIHVVAGLAETRDTETGKHTYRTQAYVALLIELLARSEACPDQLSSSLARSIVRAAPLHDIGKVAIPDHILLKPGKLTAEEFAIMQTHAHIGGEAIDTAIQRARTDGQLEVAEVNETGPLGFLLVARQIARSHHERWDGSGYPDHLAGESIPLEARIMALADAYDALVTPRVYKAQATHSQAVEIIRTERESHFEPALTDLFLSQHLRFAEIALRLGT